MLGQCRECGGQVSTEAEICPHCGAPVVKFADVGSTEAAREAAREARQIAHELEATRQAQKSMVKGAGYGFILGGPFGVAIGALLGSDSGGPEEKPKKTGIVRAPEDFTPPKSKFSRGFRGFKEDEEEFR